MGGCGLFGNDRRAARQQFSPVNKTDKRNKSQHNVVVGGRRRIFTTGLESVAATRRGQRAIAQHRRGRDRRTEEEEEGEEEEAIKLLAHHSFKEAKRAKLSKRAPCFSNEPHICSK